MSDIHHHPDRPDWGPLVRLCELLRRDSVILEPSEFMHMYVARQPDGVVLQIYKHIDTGRHLNLDATGHAYAYRHREHGTSYDPYGSIFEAVAHALHAPRHSIRYLTGKEASASVQPWDTDEAA